ncbi:MAG: DUF748 domain-containing protein [Nitrospirota bacterium]|nr:DUF748 domain-containing protein [Nitrospirota bacterium]
MRWLFRPSRLIVAALILVICYGLAGFFLVPYIIKAHVLPAVSEKLHRPVLAKEVEVNPFLLTLRVTGFEIREPDQSALIGFDEFFVNFQSVSLVHRAYVFDTIRLAIPYVSLKVSKKGRVNLADLIPPDDQARQSPTPQPEKPPSPLPAIEIDHFEITQGIVEFRDDSKPKPYSLEIVPIRIEFKNFHTKPGGDNTYAFTAELGKGELLAWEGKVSLEPIQSSGKFALSGVNLHSLWPYLHDRFRFDLTDGSFSAAASYDFNAGASPVNLHVSRANARIQNLKLQEDGSLDPVISIPIVAVDGVEVDLAKQSVWVDSIAIENASWTAWLNPDGTVNYQQLFAPKDSPPSAASPAGPAAESASEKPWSVLLRQVAIKNHAIDFEDRSLPSPAHLTIEALTAETHDVYVPLKGPLPLTVDLHLNKAGQIHVEGSIVPDPFQADLDLALKDIAIRPFQPYFEKAARIDVLSGAVDLNGTTHFATKHPKGPLLSFDGNAGVTLLAVADRDQGDEIASLKALFLNKVSLTVDPTAVAIGAITIQQPAVHVVVQSDGSLNLSKLASGDAAPSTTEEKPVSGQKSKGAPVSVTVGVVNLMKAAATFRDESLQPVVRIGISDLTGTIKGLSSKQLAKADVNLAGRVDKVAPLKIIGAINPLSENAFTDLAITFENMDLTTAGPYSGKYVGYSLSKGKLFFDLKYKISQKQLDAENSIVIDQLTFGEKINSPDATSLPVPLAVALLKDRKGRIEIDLPIRGDLSDPDFKYGRVVLSTLLNLLTKIIASPFTLMGKLIPGGGNGEELQFIEFQPGSAAVASEEMKKVDALAKALEERPGLRLDITGTADSARDREALRANKLNEQLRAMRQRERGTDASKDEPLSIDDEQRLVTDLYEQRRNQLAASAHPQPADATLKPPTLQEMEQQLAASLPVDETELRTLARQRAEQVRDQLIEAGKLAEERVFLQEVDPTVSGNEKVRSRLTIAAGS